MRNSTLLCGTALCALIFVLSACNGSFSAENGQAMATSSGSSSSASNLPAQNYPTITPTPSQGGDASLKLNCAEAQFITLLNLYRVQNSVPALRVSKAAVVAARWHAQNMVDLNYFAHSEPNGRDAFTRMNSFGFPGLGENAYYGGGAGSSSFCSWKNSAGHNANMLKASFVSTGIGRALKGSMAYWSSNFGPNAGDFLAAPLTDDTQCVIPTSLPSC